MLMFLALRTRLNSTNFECMMTPARQPPRHRMANERSFRLALRAAVVRFQLPLGTVLATTIWTCTPR